MIHLEVLQNPREIPWLNLGIQSQDVGTWRDFYFTKLHIEWAVDESDEFMLLESWGENES